MTPPISRSPSPQLPLTPDLSHDLMFGSSPSTSPTSSNSPHMSPSWSQSARAVSAWSIGFSAGRHSRGIHIEAGDSSSYGSSETSPTSASLSSHRQPIRRIPSPALSPNSSLELWPMSSASSNSIPIPRRMVLSATSSPRLHSSEDLQWPSGYSHESVSEISPTSNSLPFEVKRSISAEEDKITHIVNLALLGASSSWPQGQERNHVDQDQNIVSLRSGIKTFCVLLSKNKNCIAASIGLGWKCIADFLMEHKFDLNEIASIKCLFDCVQEGFDYSLLKASDDEETCQYIQTLKRQNKENYDKHVKPLLNHWAGEADRCEVSAELLLSMWDKLVSHLKKDIRAY